ncbi:MAG: hypothetical protein RI973_1708 [Bacteroidota bacterium]|jgi:uncharacterized protein (TIGR02145 family)
MKANSNNNLPRLVSGDNTAQEANKNRLKDVLTLIILLQASLLLAQTEPSALFEVQSTSQGLLLPRMNQAQRNDIVNPATGLMIFNTTSGCLEINMGSPSTPGWARLAALGEVSTLDCASAIIIGSLVSGKPASGVTVIVPYTGGTGGSYLPQSIASTGVAGLTITLNAGSFASGTGSLSYSVSGTPSGWGTAAFILTAGSQSCTLEVNVAAPVCRAKVNQTDYKNFMCYNLGAVNTAGDPLETDWKINGGYWQWGRKGPDPSLWLSTNTENFAHGPTSPGQANEGSISGWDLTAAPNNSWSDTTKTANDPCPSGYRLPSKAEWEGVANNNTLIAFGTWSNSSVNYTSGRFLGPDLMLPFCGLRGYINGALDYRGYNGIYWSSTEYGTAYAWHLIITPGYVLINNNLGRASALSVRCIAE